MTILTSRGHFASEYMKHYSAEVVSIRELGDKIFWKKIGNAKKIIHNAASIDCEGLNDCTTKNFDFSRKIIDYLSENNPTVNFTYISSMSILDPISDRDYLDPCKMTPYAFSKYITEIYGMKSKIVNFKSIRFSTLFYQDSSKDGLSKLVHDAVLNKKINIYNGGEATRDFMPLKIAVAYTEKVVKLINREKKLFNIVTGKETSFREIAQFLEKIIPNLRVIDIKNINNSSPVLSKFHGDSIKSLGIIKFNIKREIMNYIKNIK